MLRNRLLQITACLLILLTLTTLVACDDDYYDPIKSSSHDRRVLAEFGDEEVKYELFRFIFMSRINSFDGGDRTKWSGEAGAALWETAKSAVMQEICEIYAVFAVCRDWGIDPEGENIEISINESIKTDIDGGVLPDGSAVLGYGSVKKYEEALKKSHCTDAVRRLLYRYKACLESLYSFIVDNRAMGEVSVTDEQLSAFASGEDVAHINRLFISFESFLGNREAAYEYAEKMRATLYLANGNYTTMVEQVFSKGISDIGVDPSRGWWYGKNSSDKRDYPLYYETIFTITPGSISEIIEERNGYYIVYGMNRAIDLSTPSEDGISHDRDTLSDLYFEEMYWKDILETADRYFLEAEYSKIYQKMTISELIDGE